MAIGDAAAAVSTSSSTLVGQGSVDTSSTAEVAGSGLRAVSDATAVLNGIGQASVTSTASVNVQTTQRTTAGAAADVDAFVTTTPGSGYVSGAAQGSGLHGASVAFAKVFARAAGFSSAGGGAGGGANDLGGGGGGGAGAWVGGEASAVGGGYGALGGGEGALAAPTGPTSTAAGVHPGQRVQQLRLPTTSGDLLQPDAL